MEKIQNVTTKLERFDVLINKSPAALTSDDEIVEISKLSRELLNMKLNDSFYLSDLSDEQKEILRKAFILAGV